MDQRVADQLSGRGEQLRYQFAAGHRIRATVAFADADNFDSPVLEPAPTVRIRTDAAHASWLDLPLTAPMRVSDVLSLSRGG